jgi:hypothetical protein
MLADMFMLDVVSEKYSAQKQNVLGKKLKLSDTEQIGNSEKATQRLGKV